MEFSVLRGGSDAPISVVRMVVMLGLELKVRKYDSLNGFTSLLSFIKVHQIVLRFVKEDIGYTNSPMMP
jgi:hypothetical protein